MPHYIIKNNIISYELRISQMCSSKLKTIYLIILKTMYKFISFYLYLLFLSFQKTIFKI